MYAYPASSVHSTLYDYAHLSPWLCCYSPIHSVDTEEVLEARRRGEQKKEFDLLQAHLRDLFYNKSLIVSQINSEQVCHSKAVVQCI